MLNTNIITRRLIICKDIENEFDNILKMYNDFDTYFYATGVKYEVKKIEIIQKISYESRLNNCFIACAKTISDSSFVGFIKGFVSLKKRNVFWLSILMIDKNYINVGFGSEIFIGIEQFLSKNYKIKKIYVSVNSLNTKAINFWTKHKFGKKNEIKKNNQLIYVYLKNIEANFFC